MIVAFIENDYVTGKLLQLIADLASDIISHR
jgi:hypothetical protein